MHRESPHLLHIKPRYSNYPAVRKHSSILWQSRTSQLYAWSPRPVVVYPRRCHAVFISAEASSELRVGPVTIPSPRHQWDLPRKNTIISSSSRELSAGGNKRFFYLLDSGRAGIPIPLNLRSETTIKAYHRARAVAGGLYSMLVTLADLLSID